MFPGCSVLGNQLDLLQACCVPPLFLRTTIPAETYEASLPSLSCDETILKNIV